MKVFKDIQRATNGGSPLSNSQGVEYGTPVFVVEKRDFCRFLYEVRDAIQHSGGSLEPLTEKEQQLIAEIQRLLAAQDNFVCRDGLGVQYEACQRYNAWGCDRNMYDEWVDPESCMVCGMYKQEHKKKRT